MYLQHYGVKGMKWGVHRYGSFNAHAPLFIPKGSTLKKSGRMVDGKFVADRTAFDTNRKATKVHGKGKDSYTQKYKTSVDLYITRPKDGWQTMSDRGMVDPDYTKQLSSQYKKAAKATGKTVASRYSIPSYFLDKDVSSVSGVTAGKELCDYLSDQGYDGLFDVYGETYDAPNSVILFNDSYAVKKGKPRRSNHRRK